MTVPLPPALLTALPAATRCLLPVSQSAAAAGWHAAPTCRARPPAEAHRAPRPRRTPARLPRVRRQQRRQPWQRWCQRWEMTAQAAARQSACRHLTACTAARVSGLHAVRVGACLRCALQMLHMRWAAGDVAAWLPRPRQHHSARLQRTARAASSCWRARRRQLQEKQRPGRRPAWHANSGSGTGSSSALVGRELARTHTQSPGHACMHRPPDCRSCWPALTSSSGNKSARQRRQRRRTCVAFQCAKPEGEPTKPTLPCCMPTTSWEPWMTAGCLVTMTTDAPASSPPNSTCRITHCRAGRRAWFIASRGRQGAGS